VRRLTRAEEAADVREAGAAATPGGPGFVPDGFADGS